MAAKLTVVTAFKTEGAAESERAAKGLSREYNRLSAQLDPAIANQRRMERAQKTLDNALAKGKITQAEYNRQLALAKARYADAAGGSGRFRRSIEDMTASFGRMAAAAAVAIAALAVVALGRSLRAWEVEAKAVRQLEAALASTGNAAGRTVEQLRAHASALQRTTENANEDILVAQSQMLTFTKVSGQVFDRAIESVLDLSVRMDQDLRTSVIAVGKALNDPIRGMGSLSRAGIQFTDDQKEMVKALVEAGDLVGAQTIILKELEMQFGGSAQAARDAGSGLVPLQNAASDLMEVVGGGLAPAVRELAGDLETLASDPATLQFFADLGEVAGSVLSSLKMVTGQLDEFSVGWLAAVSRASVGYATLTRLNADMTRLLSKAIPTDHLKQLSADLDRHAEGAARAAQAAAIDLARALAGLGPAADDAGDGAGDLGSNLGDLGATADDLKKRLKDLKRELSEHEKAVRAAEQAIQRARKSYQEFSGAVDSVRDALGDLDAIELSEWVEDNFIRPGAALAIALGDWEAFGEALARVPDSAEEWRTLAEAIALVEESLDALAGRGAITIDAEAELGGMVLPGVDPEHLEEMQQEWEETLGKMSVALETMMKRAWENVQDTAAKAISGIFEKYVDTGNEAIDTLLKSFIRMLSELLVLWIANAAKRVLAEKAAAASSAAAWAAASAASGGGGMGGAGGGWIGGLSTAYKAYQGAQTGGTAGSIWGGGLGGALVIGALWAAWVSYLSSQAKKAAQQKWHTAVDISADMSQIYGAAWSEQFQQAAVQAREGLRQILDAIGGEITNLPRILIEIQGSGKRFRATVGEQLLGTFASYEEAMQAAMLAALGQADFSGVADEFVAALQRGSIRSMEQLQEITAIFHEIERVKVGDTAMEIRAFQRDIDLMKRKLEEAGISATVLGDVIEAGWQTIRDQITGATKSAEEMFRERMEQFNRELEAQRALEQAKLAAAEAEIIAAQQQIAMLQGLLAGGVALTQVTARWLEQLAVAESALAAAQAAAAAAQAALASLPAPITPGEFRGGGGGTKKSDMEALRDLLDQMSFDRLLADMTELEAGLARLEREYQQNLEKAHGNADLVARLTEEYRLQAEQLLRNVQLSAVDKFRDFMGIGADPFSQLKEGFEGASDAVRDAGFSAERTERMLRRLNQSYEEQLAILSQQQFVAIGDTLMGILERYYGGVEGFEEVRMAIERTRFELELMMARQQFEILKAEGKIASAVLAEMQKVFDFIDANPIDWDKFITPPVAPPVLDRVNDQFRETNNLLDEMARRLKSAQDGIRDFLLSLQRGDLGGRSNQEMFNAALAQFQELAAQPKNIQAQEGFADAARNLLDIARERFGSTAEFQKILDMIEGTGLDFLAVTQVRDKNDKVIFDQRFLDAQRSQLDVDRQGFQAVQKATSDGFGALLLQEERSREDILQALRELRQEQSALNNRLAAIEARRRTEKAA